MEKLNKQGKHSDSTSTLCLPEYDIENTFVISTLGLGGNPRIV